MAAAGTLSAMTPAQSVAAPPAATASSAASVAPAVSHHLDGQQQPQPSNIVTSQPSGPPAASQDPSVPDCSSASSSPPQFPTELTTSIPEESDEESASHNEPITPVSGRQSSEFPAVETRESNRDIPLSTFPALPSENSKGTLELPQSNFDNYQFPPEPTSAQTQPELARSHSKTTSADTILPLTATATSNVPSDNPTPILTRDRRPSTRTSVSSKLVRTVSNMFSARKPMAQSEEPSDVMVSTPSYHGDAPERRWSMARSSGNSPRATTPPSPTSPSESGGARTQTTKFLTPSDPPNEPISKKNRASTFGLKNRAVNFATGRKSKRASSFDSDKKPVIYNPKILQGEVMSRQVFQIHPPDGVGLKARRLSLSLPDDFQVDVGNLAQEFENQHKLLGRYRDTLGKGATAKVRVLTRKGFPNELYAVKEFRSRKTSEPKEEYEKKVKSEFSIAKSLHHPNIVETVRLCLSENGNRWNHVMEYCSEGDVYKLIAKGHLSGEERRVDRYCLFKQLLQGLAYLHANGIAHRDIKPENLLVTKDSKIKITDFGVSEVFRGIHPGTRESGGECGKGMGDIRLCNPGIVGSEPYIAPEVLAKQDKYDPRGLDVWGAGVVMIVIMCKCPLWNAARDGNHNYTDLVKAFDKWNAKHTEGPVVYTEQDYPRYRVFDDFFNPPALRRVLLMMLNPDPAKRASVEQVLANRWVKNIECCQLESYDDPVVVIDATKKISSVGKSKKTYCHNHLPPPPINSHSLGVMPGQPGY